MFNTINLLPSLIHSVTVQYPIQWFDPNHPGNGGVINPSYSYPVADHTSGGIWLAQAALALMMKQSPLLDDPELADRTLAAIAFTRRWQRSTGLIDLPKVDYDSPPDTAFLVQLLCPVLSLARRLADQKNAIARQVAQGLDEVVLSAAQGIIGRGFRTPNHRWVVCSALSQAMTLFPSLDARPYVDSILAETIDINADGEYSERSTGIYSAVCNRSLRFIADHFGRPDLLESVRSNLNFMASMMDADGTIPTSISRRQDKGTTTAPISMADSFFDMGMRDDNPHWIEIANLLITRMLQKNQNVSSDERPYWPMATLLVQSKPIDALEAPPVHSIERDVKAFFPASACWRRVKGDFSVLAAAGTTQPLSLRCGDVVLQSMEIRGTYLHVSHFQADTIEPTEQGVRLSHLGACRETPGWDLPLGRPVLFDNPHQGYYQLAQTGVRQRHLLPPLDIYCDIVEVGDGLDVRIETNCELDRILFAVAFNFATGGSIRAPNIAYCPQDATTLFLHGGGLIYHTATHGVSISAGDDCHQYNPFGDPTAGSIRILIPLVTPISRTLEIRHGKWSHARRSIVSAHDTEWACGKF